LFATPLLLDDDTLFEEEDEAGADDEEYTDPKISSLISVTAGTSIKLAVERA
jgi:hypothetical protein